MQQVTIAEFLFREIAEDVARISARLAAEAEEDQSAYDYESLDHELDQADQDEDQIVEIWAAPFTPAWRFWPPTSW